MGCKIESNRRDNGTLSPPLWPLPLPCAPLHCILSISSYWIITYSLSNANYMFTGTCKTQIFITHSHLMFLEEPR